MDFLFDNPLANMFEPYFVVLYIIFTVTKDKSTSGIEKNTAKFEKAKLEFWSFEKRIVIRILDYDTNTNQKRKHLAVWLRIGRRNIIF